MDVVLKVPANARLVPIPVRSAVPLKVVPVRAPLPLTVILVLTVAACDTAQVNRPNRKIEYFWIMILERVLRSRCVSLRTTFKAYI